MANLGKQGEVEVDSLPTGFSSSSKVSDGSPRSCDPWDPSAEYQMNHKRRGLAVIFNNEWFDWRLCLPERKGSNVDKNNLIQRLTELNFEVKHYDDLKTEELLNKITEAAERDHADADCFVCVILSHGEKDHFFSKDAKILMQDVVAPFKGDRCKSLVGKPKIFIVQACRGEQHDVPVTPMDVVDDAGGSDTNEVVVDAGVFYTLPAGADFLMCYSVAEGYYSHRETLHGSWYIQDLCEALKQHGTSLELTELLTLVNRKVSMRSVVGCAKPSYIGKKQVPCFASMLTKKLYFRAKNT
ncbi:caspase-6-like [Scleropages formosus]|uniref:Caspase-6 n=1 Tax=Scleropages formosus TaxID=113540 RepID=A0A8C9WIM1_SCLFO|nr:caspase-6 [Scleropages formosus]